MRKIKLLSFVFLVTASMSITAFAGEWTDDNRCYLKDNGAYASNEWVNIDENGTVLMKVAIEKVICLHGLGAQMTARRIMQW